jgi:regulator of RNase E activity RraA
MSSCGPDESVGGDIKFLRLKQREIGGLVTDGSVRDTDEIINYGFPVSTLYIQYTYIRYIVETTQHDFFFQSPF